MLKYCGKAGIAMTKSTTSKKIRDMAYIAMFAVIIAVGSWISVPSIIPFTLQTFAVFTATLILGGKRSFAAVALYILLGAVGVPVFSGFRSGISALIGTTGGYIFGFLLIPLTYSFITYVFTKNIFSQAVSLLFGLAICYAFGTMWYVYVYTATSRHITILAALSGCVFPYLIPDAIKLIVAFIVAKAVGMRVKLD